jgi:NitT/TauT family transport system ATP-binding protein
MLPADVLGLPKAPARERAFRLLEMTGLKEFAGHKPHMLSGGMKQRAAFCRALLSDPQLLLLDEPFGALDALTREELSLELSRLWQDLGRTALLITHDIEEAILLGDRVIVMSNRPGRPRLDISVDLPRPRDVNTAKHPRFVEIKQMARGLLFTREQD